MAQHKQRNHRPKTTISIKTPAITTKCNSKRLTLNRIGSLETEISSSTASTEPVRLPPIFVPSNEADDTNKNLQNKNKQQLVTRPFTARAKISNSKSFQLDHVTSIVLQDINVLDSYNTDPKSRQITTVHFLNCDFNQIASKLLSKVKLYFPNARHFRFVNTNCTQLGQLNALASLECLTGLTIENDAILTKSDWRLYAIFRLSHWGLKLLNGIEISVDEVQKANLYFTDFQHIIEEHLPNDVLKPLLNRLQLNFAALPTQQKDSKMNSTKWISTIDPALKNVVCREVLQWHENPLESHRQQFKHHISIVINNLLEMLNKLQLLDELLPVIMQAAISRILIDDFDINH